jgi:hypothetical protein
MNTSPNTIALDAARVFFAALLCLSVPFVSLYAAFAANNGDGLGVGLVPLTGALVLLGTTRWSPGTRFGVTFTTFLATTVYSVALITWVIQGVAG